MTIRKYLIIAALFLSTNFLQAEAPDSKIISKEVTATINAIYKPDYELLIKHTHDEVFKLAGGKEAFLKTMKQTHTFLTDKNVSIGGVEVDEKLDYFKTAENEFIFVAAKITIKVGDKSQVAPSHQLGVKKNGTDVWKYIDCSALNDELVRKMFPDFPADKKLPNGK